MTWGGGAASESHGELLRTPQQLGEFVPTEPRGLELGAGGPKRLGSGAERCGSDPQTHMTGRTDQGFERPKTQVERVWLFMEGASKTCSWRVM